MRKGSCGVRRGRANRLGLLVAAAGLLLLAGCSEEASPPGRDVDEAQLRRGAEVFQANCAQCHGSHAEGAPNWRLRDADGRFPPPPLNGTGHTWHHPKAQLVYTIREGTAQLGGNMPAWKDTLSERDIEAVIAYVQSLWPEEVYQAWAEIDRRARAAR